MGLHAPSSLAGNKSLCFQWIISSWLGLWHQHLEGWKGLTSAFLLPASCDLIWWPASIRSHPHPANPTVLLTHSVPCFLLLWAAQLGYDAPRFGPQSIVPWCNISSPQNGLLCFFFQTYFKCLFGFVLLCCFFFMKTELPKEGGKNKLYFNMFELESFFTPFFFFFLINLKHFLTKSTEKFCFSIQSCCFSSQKYPWIFPIQPSIFPCLLSKNSLQKKQIM